MTTRRRRGPAAAKPPPNRAVLGLAWERLKVSAKAGSTVKTVVAVLGSSAAAYVLGGIVVALRLNQAQFPVQDSLDVIPPSVLLVTGVRELILSSIVAALLFGLMLAVSAPSRLPDGWAFLVPVLLLVFVPFNAGGLAWPLGLFVLGALFWWMKAQVRKNDKWVPKTAPIALICLAVVLVVTLARYTVPPYKFPRAALKVHRPDQVTRVKDVFGGYIGATNDFVYLARSDDRHRTGDNAQLSAYPRDQVVYIQLDPPPTGEGTPATSIIGRYTNLDLAFTPLLDVWLDAKYHGLRLFR
jgi:hypothetical protein